MSLLWSKGNDFQILHSAASANLVNRQVDQDEHSRAGLVQCILVLSEEGMDTTRQNEECIDGNDRNSHCANNVMKQGIFMREGFYREGMIPQ